VVGGWAPPAIELPLRAYSLLTTRHALLTTHHSPLTTHYSLLTTRHSLLTTHHSGGLMYTVPAFAAPAAMLGLLVEVDVVSAEDVRR